MNKIVRFEKQDARQQIVRGTVYSPYELDTQGEFMVPEGIAPAAYDFMAKGKTHAVDKNHDGIANGSYVVESYISDGDDNFTKGSWVVGIKVPDPTLWKAIEDGVLTGFSLAGQGVRKAAKLGDKLATLIESLTVDAISLVSKPANKKGFAMLKSDQSVSDAFRQLGEALETLNQQVLRQTEAIERLQGVGKPSYPDSLSKAEPAVNAEMKAKASQELNFIAASQRLIEKTWLGEHVGVSESELMTDIAKAQVRLEALGYVSPGSNVEDNSAFFQRGGTSTFVTAIAPDSQQAALGVRTPETILKDDVPLENAPMGTTSKRGDEDGIDLGFKI